MANETPGIVKAGAAGVGVGAGGAFSWALFDKMKVADLLGQGTVFGLTVFAFVALIVMFAGYATLPNKSDGFLSRAVGWLMVFFGVVALSGVAFQMVTQFSKRIVLVNTTLSSDFDFVNRTFALQKDNALSVDLVDAHGNQNPLLFKKNIRIPVSDGDELTLMVNSLDRLPLVLQKITDAKVAKAVCADGCDLAASGGDDVDGNHAH